MTQDLSCIGQKNGFYRFCSDATAYGGLTETVNLYPTGSPYAGTELSVAVLMPEELLNAAIKGNFTYLFLIIMVLLVASLTASVVISHRYLHPVKKALHSIQNKEYDNNGDIPRITSYNVCYTKLLRFTTLDVPFRMKKLYSSLGW